MQMVTECTPSADVEIEIVIEVLTCCRAPASVWHSLSYLASTIDAKVNRSSSPHILQCMTAWNAARFLKKARTVPTTALTLLFLAQQILIDALNGWRIKDIVNV